MNIGIIGAGHIGGTLARRFAELGHTVEIANSRGPDSLADIARETKATAVNTEQAVRGNELIILTIPMKAVAELPDGLFKDVPSTTPVIDTCNYYPRERDGRIEGIENGLAESEYVSHQIGHATIKAFNNISFKNLGTAGKPSDAMGRLALPVSGDDAAQKATVMKLINQLGFDAVDNGPLANSWRHQPGTPSYVNTKTAPELRDQLAAASQQRTSQFKAA